MGLVQVAIKPLYRLGLDVPICLLLRDNMLLNFDDSLLAVLQSNLANGPVYFNCYPNYSIDIGLMYPGASSNTKRTWSFNSNITQPNGLGSSSKGAVSEN